MDKYTILRNSIRMIKRFSLKGRTIEFKINPVPENVEPVNWIKNSINEIIQKATEDLDPDDYVGLNFCSKKFSRGDGFASFRRMKDLTLNDIWEIISGIYQSNSYAFDTETFCLSVTSVKVPQGQGRGRKYNSFEEECLKRSGIITIKNNNNLCLPIAIVLGKAFADKDSLFKKLCKNQKLQNEGANKLLKSCNITIPLEGASLPELQTIQEYLQGYRITVYQYGSKGRDVIFQEKKEGLAINLIFNDSHYNTITSLTSAFCCNFFCESCHVPYDHNNEHKCQKRCRGCRALSVCEAEVSKIKCSDCNRYFRSQIGFDKHINNKTCLQTKICCDCLRPISSNRIHICNEIFCKLCKKTAPYNHQCYIPVDKKTPKIKDVLFVFYDFECRQETQIVDGTFLHEPNLCIFSQFCDLCENTSEKVCLKCGVRQQVLKVNCVPNFTEYLLNQRKLFKNVIAIAHYAQAYDLQFILHQILTRYQIKPELIMRGTKIILMTLGNVRFLDSFNYFPMSLSKLPTAFGLKELTKGYFPHFFNRLENQNYVGPIPELKYYNADDCKTEERDKILKWHSEKVAENYIFNFQKELIEYCLSDVQILTQACKKFREELVRTCNVCPFTDSVTIAGTCNKIFRRNFLQPNTVGILPKRGYRYADNQSKIAIQWLIWEEKQRNINIIHAAKQKELNIKGVKVDGFCKQTNEIFMFNGCYFHGHVCLPCNRDKPLHENFAESLNTRYEYTLETMSRLRSFGYKVIEMWECMFRKLMKENEEISLYTENHPLINFSPLVARDSFMGGRTENFVTYLKAEKNQTIKYVDIISLYPAVCKRGVFPIGHPTVLLDEDIPEDISDIYGLIKCKILPPSDLFLPVLPIKLNKKLLFVLCRTCGSNFNINMCIHNLEERALTGTWVIQEVLLAMEKGYKIQEIYEIWKYETVKQLDQNNGTPGLFTEMMNKFIKIKQEASGWPQKCTTESLKQEYIKSFYDTEQVLLEYLKIEKNPGLRCIAKLILNSFWGKFGQRENPSQTKIINQPSELYTLITNPAIYLNSCFPVNEKVLIVNYEYVEDAYDSLSTVNVVIAAYVTAQARIMLYNYMDQLKERVGYCDTDSIFYLSDPQLPDVKIGTCIGDMSDELEVYGYGSFITEFVSGGPKNYAYKVWSTSNKEYKIICKVKGISLTYSSEKLINFQKMKEMVFDTDAQPTSIISKRIKRTQDHCVVTKEETKMYQINSKKRKYFNDGTSYPYGYKK